MERCRELVKDMEEVGVLKNRTGLNYMIGISYIALREENIVMPLSDFLQFDSTLQVKDLGKSINRLKKLLAQRKRQAQVGASCSKLIPRYCESLNISSKVSILAQTITHRVERADILKSNNIQQNVVAASCLLWTLTLCSIQIQAPDIAMAARAGLSTIMSTFKEIAPHQINIITADIQRDIDVIKESIVQ